MLSLCSVALPCPMGLRLGAGGCGHASVIVIAGKANSRSGTMYRDGSWWHSSRLLSMHRKLLQMEVGYVLE